MRRLRAPALLDWRHELRCTDDGDRDGRRGGRSPARGARRAAGRERPARAVRARAARRLARAGRRAHRGRARRAARWSRGSSPPAATTRTRTCTCATRRRARDRRELGLDGSGTRITVPLAAGRLPANARLRRLVGQLVQLRPVLEDPRASCGSSCPGEGAAARDAAGARARPGAPAAVRRRDRGGGGVRARVIVRRAAEPIPLSPSRATRLGGLVIRSGRAAHETTLAGHEGEPGTRHLYGEVICDALEELQRAALDSPRPQVVVKVDRSGLNEHHPVVQRLYAGDRAGPAPDRRRRGATRGRASRPRRTRGAGARPGRAARAQRRAPRRVRRARQRRLRARRHAIGRRPPRVEPEARRAGADGPSAARRATPRWPARCASSSRRSGCIRARTAACRSLIDPAQVPPGTPVDGRPPTPGCG